MATDNSSRARYVESQYKLEIGNAQNVQLSKAIATGAEKGTFVLPKGNVLDSIVLLSSTR
jgi:hypothetical protein